MMGYPPMKSSLTELARPQEDDLDFAALLHDNGFTWDDANAVNAILTHHDLVVLRASPVADTAGIDAERLRQAVEAAYPFMSCVPPRLLAPLRAAALRTPKPEGEPE